MSLRETIASRWRTIRTVTEADTALAYGSSDNTSKYANAVAAMAAGTFNAYVRPLRGNEIEMRFRMAAEGDTATFEIHAFREKDDAVFVCGGTIEGGSAVASDPVDGSAGVYADTITITSKPWPTDIKTADADAANRQAAWCTSILSIACLSDHTSKRPCTYFVYTDLHWTGKGIISYKISKGMSILKLW